MPDLLNPSQTTLAYLAGIIDGEGSIGVYKANNSHKVVVTVKMCDPEAVGEIHEYFGGSASGYQGTNAYVFRVYLAADSAYQFLKVIRKFLRVKAEQADWAIEFHETCKPGKGHPITPEVAALQFEYATILKDLKKLPYEWEV